MGLLSRLFGRREKNKKSKDNDNVDLEIDGFRIKTLKASDDLEIVQMKGIGRNPGDAMLAVVMESAYMESKPCKCEGKWVKKNGGSAYPVAYAYCVCDKCNAQKKFEFRFE